MVLFSVLLAGCSLPVPLKFFSWATDGIAYLTTEKSVTDHGISLVARQDCALWRGITGEQICRDEGETEIAVAAAEGQPAGNGEGAEETGDSSDTWTLVALAPAAGPAEADAAALAGPETVFRNLGRYGQGDGHRKQPPDLVLVRRPAVVRHRLDPWPDLGPVPDTWLGPGVRTVIHGMRRDALDPEFADEAGD